MTPQTTENNPSTEGRPDRPSAAGLGAATAGAGPITPAAGLASEEAAHTVA